MGIELALGAVGGAVLGGLSGASGKSQTTSSKTTQEPWGAQVPYLTRGFESAGDILTRRQDATPYSGPFFAGLPAMGQAGADQAGAFAAGPGGGLASTTAQTGDVLQAGAPSYVANAMRMASGSQAGDPRLQDALTRFGLGQTPTQGVSSPLSAALEASALSGTQALSSGTGTLRDVASRALTDPTTATAASAGTYANNPTIDASVAAATRPVYETLASTTLPGLNRAATMGGNLNSSRAGMGEAMARRDAADRVGAIEATMRGDAYRTGLSLAADQRQAGLTTAAGAGGSLAGIGGDTATRVAGLQQGAGQFDTTARLNALTGAASTGLADRALTAGTQLAGNAQIGSGVNSGIGAGQAAGDIAGNNLSLASKGASILQEAGDRTIANDLKQWDAANGGWDQKALEDYWRIVASGNWGGTSTGTQTTSTPPNILGGALGGGLAGASLFAPGGIFAGAGGGGIASSFSPPGGFSSVGGFKVL